MTFPPVPQQVTDISFQGPMTKSRTALVQRPMSGTGASKTLVLSERS